MNQTILVERQAKAIAAIESETKRLGGELSLPAVRAKDSAAGQVLLLEAIAEALAGIELPDAATEATGKTAKGSKSAGKTADK